MIISFGEYVRIREGLWLPDQNAVMGYSRLISKNPEKAKKIQKLKPFKIQKIKLPGLHPKVPQIKPFGSV